MLKLSFLFVKSRAKNTQKGTLRLRVSVDGERATTDKSTKLFLHEENWDKEKQQAFGCREAKQINNKLYKLSEQAKDTYDRFYAKEVAFSANDIIRTLRNRNPKLVDLMETYRLHRAKVVQPETIRSHKGRKDTGVRYLTRMKLKNVKASQFMQKDAERMYNIMQEDGLSHNYSVRIISFIKSTLTYAVTENLIERNNLVQMTFIRIKNALKYLELDELVSIEQTFFSTKCLQEARDCFLFQCYTGLHYKELKMLDHRHHIKEDRNGKRYIEIQRSKTEFFSPDPCIIPLIEEAEEILQRYKNVLPVRSGQVYNRYLKEVAKLNGIDKSLTSKWGRSTFATLMANYGVTIPSVSKMLGHSSIQVTERYYTTIRQETVRKEIDKSIKEIRKDRKKRNLNNAHPM